MGGLAALPFGGHAALQAARPSALATPQCRSRLCPGRLSSNASASSSTRRHPAPPRRRLRALRAGEQQHGSAGGEDGGGSLEQQPWVLMGRMVQARPEAAVELNPGAHLVLAAGELSSFGHLGLDKDAALARLEELHAILPGVPPQRLASFPITDLASLVLDVRGAACKLIALKDIFPALDIPRMVSRRPSLLTRDDPAAVSDAAGKLAASFARAGVGAGAVGELLETNPDVLFCDVDQAAKEVGRLFGRRCNPYAMIAADPSLVFKSQRNGAGQQPLGPGAEF